MKLSIKKIVFVTILLCALFLDLTECKKKKQKSKAAEKHPAPKEEPKEIEKSSKKGKKTKKGKFPLSYEVYASFFPGTPDTMNAQAG